MKYVLILCLKSIRKITKSLLTSKYEKVKNLARSKKDCKYRLSSLRPSSNQQNCRKLKLR